MTYKEFKSNIINLGFEEEDVFEDNDKTLIEAANRALIFLVTNIEPKEKYKHYEIPEDEIKSSYRSINLEEFNNFDGISLKAPKINGKAITDFYYEDNTLYISSKYSGVLSVCYRCNTELIPYDVSDDYKIPVRFSLITPLQLLTAYYIWLDDDERKAVVYYNQFNEQLQVYRFNKQSNENQNKAVIEGGIRL